MIEQIKIIPFVFLLIGINNTSLATVINVPLEQPTVQAGINAANSGDTVLVQPGTYKVNWDSSRCASGIFYTTLSAGDRFIIRKAVVSQ